MDTILQVVIRSSSGIPANDITNTFCISNTEGDDVESERIVGYFKDFYDVVEDVLYSNQVEQDGHLIKFYDAAAPSPNYPYYEGTFDLTGVPSGTALPTEVAVCLSFQAPRVAGEAQARRRGRVYLGPVNEDANVAGRPGASMRTSILAAAVDLQQAMRDDSNALAWCVWSTADAQSVVLTEAWMDDAWDTQRSRGLETTSRISVNLPGSPS